MIEIQEFMYEGTRQDIRENFPAEYSWFLVNQREYLEGAYPKIRPGEMSRSAILAEASLGAPRPRRKDMLYGSLMYRVRMTSEGYDEEFCKELGKIAPRWLLSAKENTMMDLIDMAFFGHPRPKQRTKAGRDLSNYTSPSQPVFCPKFTATLRDIAPEWFNCTPKHTKPRDTRTVEEKKAELISLAKIDGLLLPNRSKTYANFNRYTAAKSDSVDPDFAVQIRVLAPQWFRREQKQV